MRLPDELHFAMLGVGWQAKRHKIPGPLARTMIDVAQKSLDLWWRDEQAAFRFARLVMSRPSMIRKLPWRLRNPVGDRSICWNISRISMERNLASIYYSSRGYWKGLAAIKNISATAKVTEQQAKDWLKKQAIWQIYLPAPRHIPRPKFDIATPNEVHQADLIFLPHERVGGRPFAMLSRSLASPAATKRLSL